MMNQFMGEYNHTMDAKGRLIVPAKFREAGGDKFIVTKGLDSCLFVFTEENTVEPYTGTSYWECSENITDEEQIKNQCKGIKAGNNRNQCAYFALKDKNPTGNGTYWKNFLK